MRRVASKEARAKQSASLIRERFEERYMNTINQICAFMENRPGQLLEMIKILSSNGIDLRALNVAESENYGVLRFICDDAEAALELLKENGYIASKNEVCAIAVPDRPGGLEELLSIFAADGVDIAYMYSVFSFAGGKAHMIICAKDADSLRASIEKNNIATANNELLGIK